MVKLIKADFDGHAMQFNDAGWFNATAAAVIMEQGCTHKHYLKANGIKIDTLEVSRSTKIK